MTTQQVLARLFLPSMLALTACGAGVSTTAPQHIENVSAMNVRGPYVPAGTLVTVRMDEALDTMANTAGQPFTATVETMLQSPNGTVLVPAGAKVYGTLASSGSVDQPRLRLDLERVETTRGSAPIEAAIRHAQRTAYAGPTQFVPVGDDPFLYPYDGGAWGWWGPIGGGPVYQPWSPTEIHIPRGASIQLVLTRPLIPPGTTVR